MVSIKSQATGPFTLAYAGARKGRASLDNHPDLASAKEAADECKADLVKGERVCVMGSIRVRSRLRRIALYVVSGDA